MWLRIGCIDFAFVDGFVFAATASAVDAVVAVGAMTAMTDQQSGSIRQTSIADQHV